MYITKSKYKAALMSAMCIIGPGIITMEADNDAGAVASYVQAGAQYGLNLCWLLLLLLPITYFVQEMVVRLGIVTGQGHAALIYKRFGRWWGNFSLIDLLIVNFLTLITEFAAIAMALSKMNIAPIYSVTLSTVAMMALVLTGSYLRWERIVIGLCLLDVAWVFMANHAAKVNYIHNLPPSIPVGGLTKDFVFLAVAIVGTTIAPWQLFFQQSCVADKKLKFRDLNLSRVDTLIGAFFTIMVATCMLLVGNAAYVHHIPFTDPSSMSVALKPYLGEAFTNLLLIMIVNAAVLGTTTISLASAWAYGEVRGWPHSLHQKFKDAPWFYTTYVGCVGLAGALVLIPGLPLETIIIAVQVLAAMMLPSALVFLQILLMDKDLMGDYVNKTWQNVINWVIIAAFFLLSLTICYQSLK